MISAQKSNATHSSNPFRSPWLNITILIIPLLAFTYFQWQSGEISNLIFFRSLLTKQWGNNSLWSKEAKIDIFEPEVMRQQYGAQCPDHSFKTHIFSTDPLIIYIEDYLSQDEARYLVNLAIPHYKTSPVSKGFELEAYSKDIRSSESAVLPYDAVVSCIEARSVDFQGYPPVSHLEDIQVVKYGINDHFRPHFDWFSGMTNPRISTIFAYLECDDCIGGATQFPELVGRFSAKWCKFIDCEDDSGAGGVAFKPLVGNAVFWSNLFPNGTGHPGVWHAGMPVKKGRKVGLNIFTRQNVAYPAEEQ